MCQTSALQTDQVGIVAIVDGGRNARNVDGGAKLHFGVSLSVQLSTSGIGPVMWITEGHALAAVAATNAPEGTVNE